MDGSGRPAARPGRRQFLQGIAGAGLSVAGLSLLAGCSRLGGQTGPALGEPPPETTRLRIHRSNSLCVAPQYLAEPLLRAEGFTDLEYVGGPSPTPMIASGEVDILVGFSAPYILRVDANDPVVMLAGLHVGCFELFGTDQVRAVRDLKGKTVSVLALGEVQHVFLSTIAAYVGLDPNRDINFVTLPPAEAMQRLEAGTIDAFLGFPPQPQDLRARKVGHVVVNSSTDKPWSQYFCCMVIVNRQFVEKHPVATRRVLRAFLKADDLCAADPDRAAQYVVDNGYAPRLDYARQTLHEVSHSSWREYDPEDAVRFYSLRLQEIGMIKSAPDAIIQKGTNWRFLNELKQELKA